MQQECVRREAWDLAKSVYNVKTIDKATFYSLTEDWVMPVPSSKKRKERGVVVDTGASTHMLSRTDPSSEELETFSKIPNPRSSLQSMEKCKHIRKHRYTFTTFSSSSRCSPVVRQALRRTRFFPRVGQWSEATDRSRRTRRVLLQVQQDYEVTKLTQKHRETEAIFPKNKKIKVEGNIQAARDRLRGLPEWPEEFAVHFADAEVPAPANTSQDSDSERPT